MTGLLERLITPLGPDALRELRGPLHTRRIQGIIKSITPLTTTAAEIEIQVGRSWPGHTPGQHMSVGVDIEGVRHTRSYSITSTPNRGRLVSIAVQAKPEGLVSRYLVTRARTGSIVQLGQPTGDFTLQAAVCDRILMLTGGSGITPAIGMIRSLANRATPANGSSDHDVVLIHHAPTRSLSMFADELDDLASRHSWLHVENVATRENGTHLDRDRLNQLCPDWADRDTFACGPEPLLQFCDASWADAVRSGALHTERFVAPTPTPTNAAGGTVTFGQSQIQVPAGAELSLLEVAESAKLTPASGCRMGICHTCTTRLDQGSVIDRRDGRRYDAGSHVQICVSVAHGDVTLDL